MTIARRKHMSFRLAEPILKLEKSLANIRLSISKNYLKSKGTIMAKCGRKCDIYSRIVGYFRPVSNWNAGKKEEFKDRKVFNLKNQSNGEK